MLTERCSVLEYREAEGSRPVWMKVESETFFSLIRYS